MRPGRFFSELRRRRVWRVAGAYALVVWMAVEIVLETAPVLGFPDWVPRVAVVLAIVGFPVTLILAWAFDITPQGVVRTAASPDAYPGPGSALRSAPGSAPGSGAAPVRASDAGSDAGSDAPPGDRVVMQPRPTRLAGVFGAGILVALVGMGAYTMFVPGAVVRPESVQAIAVLPFADRSADQDQAYFADGVTEELINRLARIGEIRVAARTSSFALRDEDASLDEIARRLNVDAVVEGSIQRDGDRLRVTVELVDVASGFQIWSEKYDRTIDDIFAIQDEISSAIVDALRLQLMPEMSRLRAGTGSVRAHDAYLLGLTRWHARTEADLKRALDYFQGALAEDDTYAPAHAGLALTYSVLPGYSDMPVAEAAERGSEAAARALMLDAQLAEAHAAIGQIAQGLEWNLAAAEMAYRRAIEFQPSYATGHQWYAEVLLIAGRLAEARVELEQALMLDPLSVSARYLEAYLLTIERDYPAALAAYETVVRENPDYRLGRVGLLFFCLAADCHDAALTMARNALGPDAAPLVRAVIEADRDPSLRPAALATLRSTDAPLPPAMLGLLHMALGDRAGALDRVEQAYTEGADPNLPLLLVHPLFDPLRRDPRFRAVAEGIGAEAPSARLAPHP